MFLYRYLQTTNSFKFKFILEIKNYLLSYLVFFIIVLLLILIPGDMQRLSNHDIIEGLKEVDPIAYSLAKDHVSIGFSVGFFFIVNFNIK